MSQPRTSTTTQSTSLPDWQQEHLSRIGDYAYSMFQGGGPSLYDGSFFAGPTAAEQSGRRGALDYARGEGSENVDAAQEAWRFGLGDVMSPDTNPYLRESADAAVSGIYRDLNEQALPSIMGGAVESGNVGSSRQGIAEGIATRGAIETAANTRSSMYNAAYNRGLDTFDRSLANSGAMYDLGLQPYMTEAAVGAADRADQQQGIDEQVFRHNYGQMLPYMMLSQYLGYVSGNYGGQGTSSTTTPTGPLGFLF